jgi:hypothetical protein
MALRITLAALLLASLAACIDTEPGERAPRGSGPISGITPQNDGPDQVVAVLGQPSSRANGWWRNEHDFDMEFRVWYYKGVGRVIFDRYGMVYRTEADKHQLGGPN